MFLLQLMSLLGLGLGLGLPLDSSKHLAWLSTATDAAF